MRYLLRQVVPDDVRSVLTVQTCNADLLGHVVADAQRRFPHASHTVLFQRGMQPYLPQMAGVELIENLEGGRQELLRGLRARAFEAVCVVASGEKGFWKLKLLPFVLNPGSIWAYDRLAEPKLLTLQGLGTLVFGRREPLLTPRRTLAPLIFLDLVLYYRRRRKRLDRQRKTERPEEKRG